MEQAREKQNGSRGFYDYSLVIIICFLVCFGMIMLYSTVSYTAQLQNITATEYLKNQIIATVLGFIAMFAISFMDYHKFARFAVLGYLASYVLIFLVLTPLGITVNGATRWLGVGSFSFQPAEFVKIAVILFLAYIINKWNKKIVKLRYVFAVLMLIAPISVLLWQITDNLSTALIVAGIAVVVVFIASPDYKFFVSMGIIAIGVVAFIVFKILLL